MATITTANSSQFTTKDRNGSWNTKKPTSLPNWGSSIPKSTELRNRSQLFH